MDTFGSIVLLPIFDSAVHKSLDIQRRDDLIPASVIIGYRITNSVNGQSEIDYAVDKWGPHGFNSALDPDIGPGVVIQTLDLQGLFEGNHHAWMTIAGSGGHTIPVLAVKCKVETQMTYAHYDAVSASSTPDTDTAGNKTHVYNSAEKHAVITVTNGVSGTYATIGAFTEGESFIQGNGGIAQYLFTMMSVLQYEGEYVKVESSFANNISLLNRLNLAGGRAEWAGMNAQIQDIEENWGRKETRVRVGVSKHLSADQLSALLNMWRFRRTAAYIHCLKPTTRRAAPAAKWKCRMRMAPQTRCPD